MKVYMELLKYDLKKYGIRFVLPVIMILAITIYRVFITGINERIFEISNIAIDMPVILFFVITQIVVPMGIFFQLKEAVKSNLFLTVPDVRKKIIVYKGFLLAGFFVLSIIIAGLLVWKDILFYTFIFTWYVSLLLVIFWGFHYIYNSPKFFILKLAFQFGILWVPYLGSVFKELRWVIVLSYISLIISIQIRNFIIHFINYKENESGEKKSLRYYLEGDFQTLFGTHGKETSIKNILTKITKDPSRFNYIRLYQYSFFKYTGNIMLLIIIWFIASFIIPFLYGTFGFKSGSIMICIIILSVSALLSRTFKMKDKIESIYLITMRNRAEFEKDILLTVFWYYSRLVMFIALFITYYHLKIYGNASADFDPLFQIAMPVISMLAGFLIIYLVWVHTFKNIKISQTNMTGA